MKGRTKPVEVQVKGDSHTGTVEVKVIGLKTKRHITVSAYNQVQYSVPSCTSRLACEIGYRRTPGAWVMGLKSVDL